MPDDELLDLAPAVGLDAVDDAELDDLQRRLDAESAEVREAFGRQVAATREAMASISHVTATAPPETLRDRVLAAARTEAERGASTTDRAEPTATVIPLHRRRRLMYAAAAAVVAGPALKPLLREP